jgi:DNA repair exonuclease SbcCD ATPase subunit
MIKSIRVKNIKGKTFTQELTGKDVFIGRNGSGKSTIQQALALAILGYVPGEGKDESDTFELSSSVDGMTAGLQTDTFTFDRTIKRIEKLQANDTKKISFGQSLTVSPSKGEKTDTEMKARIAAEMGNFPMVFDFDLFMKLSDAKRRDQMYSLAPITDASWDKAKVAERLNKLLTDSLKTSDPDLYAATAELIKDSLVEWPDGYDLTSGIQNMIDWTELQQKGYNSKKGDATGAVRELNEMKNELEETDRGITSKENELQELRKNYTDVHGQITAGEEIKRQWDGNQFKISNYKTEIEQLTLLLSSPDEVDYDGKVNAVKEKIKQTDIAAATEDIQLQINTIRNTKSLKVKELDGVKKTSGEINAKLFNLKSVKKNILEKGAGVCVLSPDIKCEKDFTKFIDHVGSEAPKLQEEYDALLVKVDEFEKEIRNFNIQESNLESDRRKINADFSEEAKANSLLRDEIDLIRKQEQSALQLKQGYINKQSALQDELNKLVGEKMPTFAPLDELKPQYEALGNQIIIAEGVLKDKQTAKTTLSNKQTAIRSAASAENYFKGCKSISDSLGSKGIQGELVKSILGPIEAAVNQNLTLMGVNNLTYFTTESETGKEVFHFGWIKEGRKTKFNVLSKGEKLMFLCAFLVALLERANPPVKVLAIDNVENLDEFNLPNVLRGLDAISHKLDNILVAGVIKSSDLVGLDKWKVWDLTPKAEELSENALLF